LDYLNMIFTTLFGIEFVLKLFAFRFKVSYDIPYSFVLLVVADVTLDWMSLFGKYICYIVYLVLY